MPVRPRRARLGMTLEPRLYIAGPVDTSSRVLNLRPDVISSIKILSTNALRRSWSRLRVWAGSTTWLRLLYTCM